MVRFLHVADLHLGMRITRFSPKEIEKVREARFQALQHIRTEVQPPEAGYQFVVIAGDLFDDVLVSRDIARRAFEFLETFRVPVLVLPGNHDPLQAGSIWDIDPWKQAGQEETHKVRVLRHREPFEIVPDVTIFPCPVLRKTSSEDPTAWIRDHPRTADSGIRIGIAHGSVMDRPNLPDDDHPISPTAPDDLQLDYLALGHWHNAKEFVAADGHARMSYPGVHEPMRFKGEDHALGWRPYSSGGSREEFRDIGPGMAMSVTLGERHAAPKLERIRVGYYEWTSLTRTIRSTEEMGELINEIAEMPNKERTLLRLQVSGTLPISALPKIDDLRNVLVRYVVGELDDAELTVEPTEEEIHTAIGSGVLSNVFTKLREQAATPDTEQGTIATHAIQLLYRIARSASA